MTRKLETALRQRIQKSLEREFSGWWKHCHGDVYTPGGLPDLFGVHRGIFFGFEVKTPGGGDATDLQEFNLEQIRAAGGVAAVVRSYDEARAYVIEALRARGPKGRP